MVLLIFFLSFFLFLFVFLFLVLSRRGGNQRKREKKNQEKGKGKQETKKILFVNRIQKEAKQRKNTKCKAKRRFWKTKLLEKKLKQNQKKKKKKKKNRRQTQDLFTDSRINIQKHPKKTSIDIFFRVSKDIFWLQKR